jgi:hypothetical protein
MKSICGFVSLSDVQPIARPLLRASKVVVFVWLADANHAPVQLDSCQKSDRKRAACQASIRVRDDEICTRGDAT